MVDKAAYFFLAGRCGDDAHLSRGRAIRRARSFRGAALAERVE
jgi:hypothetical protein